MTSLYVNVLALYHYRKKIFTAFYAFKCVQYFSIAGHIFVNLPLA